MTRYTSKCSSPVMYLGALLTLSVPLTGLGCSTNQSAQKQSSIEMDQPGVMSETKGDTYIRRFDLDGDSNPEITRYYKLLDETQEDSDAKKRRLVRKEIDVDYDGGVDVIRHYNEQGELKREKVDLNRNGTFDVVNHFKGESKLVRKELLDDEGENVRETRYYSGDKLSKVERDADGDGQVDYWEFYQDEELQRIGYDENGDEKVDRWVHRETKVASEAEGEDLP